MGSASIKIKKYQETAEQWKDEFDTDILLQITCWISGSEALNFMRKNLEVEVEI